MIRHARRLAVSAAVAAGLGAFAAAAPDPKYAWNLGEIYPSEAAWVKALDGASADVPKIASCRGKLTESAATLFGCLEAYYAIDRQLTQLGVYASMNYDLDTRVGRAQQMQEQARQARTAFASASAWMRPEALDAGAAKIRTLVATSPRPAPGTQPLGYPASRAPHVLYPKSTRAGAKRAVTADRDDAVT